MIERELYEKGLPEGKVSVPVAGYLYFALPNAKKNVKINSSILAAPSHSYSASID